MVVRHATNVVGSCAQDESPKLVATNADREKACSGRNRTCAATNFGHIRFATRCAIQRTFRVAFAGNNASHDAACWIRRSVALMAAISASAATILESLPERN